MKVRVSDYIADFFAEKGVTQVFCVVGGGSMYLNNSLGHHPKINCLYNHHEQASAMAAEAYARVNNTMAITCVTSGPGAINALNGVIGAFQDSIPMIVLSGQAKTTLTLKYNHSNVRTLGNQEYDIVPSLTKAVKYAELIMDPQKIKYYLEKAYHLATTGRKGPCWLDIPLDIQGSFIETDDLIDYNPEVQKINKETLSSLPKIIELYKNSKRPVLYAGNGIRLSGGLPIMHKLIKVLNIPVVTCWDSIDLISTEDQHYCGRAGLMGDRAGNFAVQNSDFLLCIGNRLNIYQVGWDVSTWARNAFVIDVDIDPYELTKPTVRIDMPICDDASLFMSALINAISETTDENKDKWIKQCNQWKLSYPVVQPRQYDEKDQVNVYAFIDKLGRLSPKDNITVVANGSASVVGSQTFYIKENDRFIMNCAISSMGYGLPASIGACIANNKNPIICIEGDGSIMMNLQELQTVVTNKLPIKIFIINNSGYHQWRLTENNMFPNDPIGIGPESGDLGFPNFKKLSEAFGIPYKSIKDNSKLDDGINETLNSKGCVLCEVFVSTTQKFEPKSSTKRLASGKLVSPPLEDLAPFLSREELKKNMYIPVIDNKEGD